MIRRLFLVLVLVVLAASALSACESCVAKGAQDPLGGGPYNSALCWTSDGGPWTYCWGGSFVCSGGSVDASCPASGEGNCAENVEDCVLTQWLRSSHVADTKCDGADVAGRCLIARRTLSSFLR